MIGNTRCFSQTHQKLGVFDRPVIFASKKTKCNFDRRASGRVRFVLGRPCWGTFPPVDERTMTKRPWDETSPGRNVPRDVSSSGTFRPRDVSSSGRFVPSRNVPRTKRPSGETYVPFQNVPFGHVPFQGVPFQSVPPRSRKSHRSRKAEKPKIAL